MDYQDQLTLLSDILKNQQAQQYGTADEFSQIYRLAQSLQEEGQLDDKMQQTITQISNFCSTRDCLESSSEINQWIQSIDELTNLQ